MLHFPIQHGPYQLCLILDSTAEAVLDLDELYRLLRGSHVQAVGIVNTLRDPLVVLDDDFRVLRVRTRSWFIART